jgi:hypothetical protein
MGNLVSPTALEALHETVHSNTECVGENRSRFRLFLGSLTKITFQGKEQTLHELWDAGILATETASARQMAQRLDEEQGAEERKAWEAGSPKEWADESIALTTKYVYPLPESHQISEEYAKRALPILHKRLAQAGVRLAWLHAQ